MPWTAVVPDNIDAMRKLIMQDRHVPYRGYFSHQHRFDIAWTSCRKNRLFSLNPAIAQKSYCQLAHRKVGKNTMAVLQNTFIRSSQVTNYGSMCFRNKTTVQHVGLRRQAKSNESCFWKKHFKANVRLFLQQNWWSSDCLTWTTLHGQFWKVPNNFFWDIRKTNKKRRIIVHNGNASTRTSAQISAFLFSFHYWASFPYCILNEFVNLIIASSRSSSVSASGKILALLTLKFLKYSQ